MVKKSFLLCLIVVFALNAEASWSDRENASYILGLHYPQSYDFKAGQGFPDKPYADVHYVKYKVRLSFPSKEVLHFYDDKLKAMGWVPFVEPNYPKFCNREWGQIIDGTVEGIPIVHRLCAQWVSKDKTSMFLLVISYHSIYQNWQEKRNAYYRGANPNNNIQKVSLQFMPFNILPPPEPEKSD
jgi:hypothetical protein